MTKHPFLVLGGLLAFGAFASEAEAGQKCRSQQGNLCFTISGTAMQRINSSAAFQRALRAVAAKMPNKQVIIYQGYRTPSQQAAIVRRHCGSGRSSCSGAASPRTSRHVISIAADPMVRGNVVKPLCYAENQARVEHLGPRSAAAVYGYSQGHTWGHIDDSTGSNYTPRNCGRNEGLGASSRAAASASRATPSQPDTGAPASPRVEKYKQKRQAARSKPPVNRYSEPANPDRDWARWLWENQG